MAIIYVGSSSVPFDTSGAIDYILPVPADIQVGDIMFANHHASTANDFITSPDGWTLVGAPRVNGYWVYYKIADSNDVATHPSYTWSLASAKSGVGAIHAWRGQATTDFINDVSNVPSDATGGDVNLFASGIVTTVPSTILFFGQIAGHRIVTVDPTNPGTFTRRNEIETENGSFYVADYEWASSGSAGSIAATIDFANPRHAIAVALVPSNLPSIGLYETGTTNGTDGTLISITDATGTPSNPFEFADINTPYGLHYRIDPSGYTSVGTFDVSGAPQLLISDASGGTFANPKTMPQATSVNKPIWFKQTERTLTADTDVIVGVGGVSFVSE